MNANEADSGAENYFEGSLQSFVTPAIPVVEGMALEPRRGRPERARTEVAPHTDDENSCAGPVDKQTSFTLECEVKQEADGRWIAELSGLPAVAACGATRNKALEKLKALSIEVLSGRSKDGEKS
jgi:predicted RNase H-like HicB family nuclease